MTVHQNLIGGEWLAASASKPNINPSNLSDVIGEYGQSDSAAAASAIEAAAQAAPAWAAASPQVRFDLLDAIGTEILARREELGRLLSRLPWRHPGAHGRQDRHWTVGRAFSHFASQRPVRAYGAGAVSRLHRLPVAV